MSQTSYSAAALAAAVGVPRTTINDWLTRYEDYIDSIAVGKRKVYSENSLAVLQEIAALRDAGKSSIEIEAVLAGKHGIKPEVAVAEQPAAASETEPAAADVSTPAAAAGSADSNEAPQLPAVKEIERSAMELTAFIADLRNQQRRSARRSWVVFALLGVIIVILAAVSVSLFKGLQISHGERQFEYQQMMGNMEKLNANFAAELKSIEAARQQERTAAQQRLTELKAELTRLQQARAAEVARLTEQLAADRAKLQAEMQRQEKSLTEKNAAEKALLIKKMEGDAQAAQAQLQALRQELKKAGSSLNELSGKLQQISAEQAAQAARTTEIQSAQQAAQKNLQTVTLPSDPDPVPAAKQSAQE